MPVAVTALLAVSALCLGAVYPWAYLPLVLGSIAVGIVGLRGDDGRPVPRPVATALAAVAVAIVLQLVPLPRSWLSGILPETHAFLARVDAVYAAGDSAHPLSVRPSATAVALMFYLAFALLFAGVCGWLSRSASAVRILATGIAATGTLLAMLALVQRAAFDGRILWLWQPAPHDTLTPVDPFGPFINRNHFAGWMIMALPLVLGAFAARCAAAAGQEGRTLRERVLWLGSPAFAAAVMLLVAAAVMALSVVLTLSRSGVMGLVVAVAAFGAVMLTRTSGIARVATVGGLAIMLLAVLLQAGTQPVLARFATSASSLDTRAGIWSVAAQIADRFWPTGTGLNTFGVVTAASGSGPGFRYTEAHNDYLQLAAEGGLLVGIPVAALAVAVVLTIARRTREVALRGDAAAAWIRFGAVTGLVAIAIQATVDFSLHIPANAALFAVLLAIAAHPVPRPVRRRSDRRMVTS